MSPEQAPPVNVAMQPMQLIDAAQRFGLSSEQVEAYVTPDEELVGFGSGGSESLVMFIESPTYGRMVRKVCSEALSAVPWDPKGTGVMTPPSTKGSLQVDYLQSLPEQVKGYFPQVHNIRNEEAVLPCGTRRQLLIYDQALLTGEEMSSFVGRVQPTPEIVAHMHREVMRLLADKVHSQRVTENTADTIQESYLDKIASRLELSREAAPETFSPVLDAEAIIINGRPYRNISSLLGFFGQQKICDMLEPKKHSLVMGDTNTENVMITKPDALLEAINQAGEPNFTYDDIGLKFIDPRAIGFRTTGGETVDDYMYDNKPVHNSLGNYDAIHNEHFDLSLTRGCCTPSITFSEHTSNPFETSYKNMEEYFSYIMDGWDVSSPEFQKQDPNWLLRFTFLMGSHFAAMPPFHFKKDHEGNTPEDIETQKRAIAIYCQGIIWLNKAQDMIEEQEQRLYGLSMGGIQPSNR